MVTRVQVFEYCVKIRYRKISISISYISQTQDDMDDKNFAISFHVLMFPSDIGRKFNSVQFHFSCEINFLPW